MPKREWFDEWFNSPYYHILYRHRDEREASEFLDRCIQHLKMPHGAKVMDLACGKGRHAMALSKRGFDVTGLDLSTESIKHARRHANESLLFEVHDMRRVYRRKAYFDYIFNLFTSFGYFDSKAENLAVVDATIKSLKRKGRLLLDFLNADVVIAHLVEQEEKTIENIRFRMTRRYTQDEFIVKDIAIDDEGRSCAFQEKVKAIRRADFLDHFDRLRLKVLDVFGDYQLSPYCGDLSPRLIFVVEK